MPELLKMTLREGVKCLNYISFWTWVLVIVLHNQAVT